MFQTFWHILGFNYKHREWPNLGKPALTITDDFLEKFQTAFDPPPSFSKNHIADFWGHVDVCAFWYNLLSNKTTYNYAKLKFNHMRIWWHWHVARIISSQKIYGLYGLKHQIVEISGDVTDAGRTNNKQTVKIELLSQWMIEAEFRNRATQPMDAGGWVSQFGKLS